MKVNSMFINQENDHIRAVLGCGLALLLAITIGCSGKQETPKLKKLAAGAKNAGFLSTYDNLKPNQKFENTLSYVKQDDARNVRKYFAVIVEPVEIYMATSADISKLPDRGRTALAAYFQHAITRAMSDAFPVVQEPGPLVLRLRTALIGVDVGSAIQSEKADAAGEELPNSIDIGKVAVEMEMVDSVTGEQIAAAVDTQSLGAGAVVGSVSFSRDERFAAARDAFDGWAARLREFLDSAHELSAEESLRVTKSYRPYSDPPATK